jgi:hypothetical protein
MKKISKQAARVKAVGNVLASLRIEKLTPSETVVQGMQACMDRQLTTAELLQQVVKRHVPVQRG